MTNQTQTMPSPAPQTPATPTPSAWLTQARMFVARIEGVCASDPGARAALRSGLGKPLAEVPRMHRIVAPLLPPSAGDDETQRAFYAVASLIAAQKSETLRAGRHNPDGDDTTAHAEANATAPSSPPAYGTSLGSTFAMAVATDSRNGLRENAAETRLNLLTRQSTAGLHRHLPSAVRQLCDKRTPPDWAQLLVHLRAWPRDRKEISRRWLQDFYRARHKATLDAARESADTMPDHQP
ncbi:type I-E CRISPR-associated protein Cse2/CasB [Streptomyces sp. NPDC026673]|uniref:type I-E CRISPR-associated protein Cse2/CasB n=1 Tax=Streptomyces sp. NPDC026673 TaxID=3155724 RepID=UPI0033D185D2